MPKRATSTLDHRDKWVEIGLYEAALHGTATLHYLLRAVGDVPQFEAVASHHHVVDHAYEAWRGSEILDRGMRGAVDGQ